MIIFTLDSILVKLLSIFTFSWIFKRTHYRGKIRHTFFAFWGTGEEAKLFQGKKDTIGEQAREHKKTHFRFLGNR